MRSGTFARIRLRAAVRRQSWRKRVGTPAAWQAVRHAVRQRRTAMPSRWKTSGLVGSRRARRRARASAMGGEMRIQYAAARPALGGRRPYDGAFHDHQSGRRRRAGRLARARSLEK